jgi:hypothetical protein
MNSYIILFYGNGYLQRVIFPLNMVDLSIAMLIYQRVYLPTRLGDYTHYYTHYYTIRY